MIAIKDTEMPKSCYECVFRRTRISDDITHHCNLINTNLHRDWTKNRHSGCPLVEIVTCKDCKYRDPEDKFCDCGHTIKWSSPRKDNFYCADGERRE